MRTFKFPEERKGRGEQKDKKGDQGRQKKDVQSGKNHWPPPSSGGRHSPDLPVASGTVPSPLWQDASQYFPHLLSNRVYMKEEKEEDRKGEF